MASTTGTSKPTDPDHMADLKRSVASGATGTANNAAVEGSGYAIVKARLEEQGIALQSTIEQMNARRLEVFGGSKFSVPANTRVRTFGARTTGVRREDE